MNKRIVVNVLVVIACLTAVLLVRKLRREPAPVSPIQAPAVAPVEATPRLEPLPPVPPPGARKAETGMDAAALERQTKPTNLVLQLLECLKTLRKLPPADLEQYV